MPVLAPADIAEMVRFGLLGWALSRFSGCWVGLKVLAEQVNATTRLDLSLADFRVALPDEAGLSPDRHIRWPDPWPSVEQRLLGAKLPAARAFARRNALDRPLVRAARPRLAVVASGKSQADVLEALASLGLTAAAAAEAGLSLYKVGMPWPLDAESLAAFVAGHETCLVVEEKRDIVEAQLKSALHALPDGRRPRVIGRFDEAGRPLFPQVGELSADLVARALGPRLQALGLEAGIAARLALLEERAAAAEPALLRRGPYFCSGCPHNGSTKVPEGSRALGGVGCHYMAVDMERETATFTHMGGEGAT